MIARNLIRKELHQLRWFILTGLLLNICTAVITVVTFHYFERLVKDLPQELLEMLVKYDLARELMSIFGDFSLYIWSQWYAKNLFQLAALFAIIFAASQFAGEISKRTMGFYLTRPITRQQGYLAKITAGLLTLTFIFGTGTVAFWLVSLLMGYTALWGKFFAALTISLVWIAVYYQLACIISVFNKEPIMASVLAGIAGVLLSLPGLFAASRQFSIFYQMRAVEYYILGNSLLPSLLIGLALNIFLLLAGKNLFANKDF